MHYLFVVPLVGGIILALLLKTIPNLGRLSLNLWNSAVAVLTAGMLFRGIVHLSDPRSTLLVSWPSFCYFGYSIAFPSEEEQ